MNKHFKIAGIGELLWDVLPAGKQLGGAPCNFAFHTMQTGGTEAYVVSALGNDPLGLEILDVLKKLKLSTDYIQTVDYPTGTVDVELDANNSPIYNIKENVAWDNIGFNDELKQLAASLDAVCFGSLAQRNAVSRNAIFRFVEATPATCLRVFDINLRQAYYSKEVIETSLRLANALKLNDEELPVLAEMFGYPLEEAIPALMKDFQLDLVAYTKGSAGSDLYYKGQFSSAKVPKIKVVDAVGAGDSFTARMVVGILNGEDLRSLHQEATRLAAFVCTQNGATPVIDQRILNNLNS